MDHRKQKRINIRSFYGLVILIMIRIMHANERNMKYEMNEKGRRYRNSLGKK